MTSSEASNGYGQWLLPEDAERITKPCNTVQRPSERRGPTLLDTEDEDLNAAIAASLRDSSPVAVVSSPAPVESTQDDLNVAIAASLRNLSTVAVVSSPVLVESTPATIASSPGLESTPATVASSPGLVEPTSAEAAEVGTPVNEAVHETKNSSGENK